MQVHSNMLSAAEVKARLPDSQAGWIGGMETPSDGRAEPSMAAPALAAAARRLGVTLLQNCAARGVETTNGMVSEVVTEKGRIRAGAVLLAGGAWSTLFCRRHGIILPQAMVNGTAFRTTPGPVTHGALGTPGHCMRRREDGGYTVAFRGRGTMHLTPDGLRFARQFWPAFKQRRAGLKFSVGKPFLDALLTGARWSFDEPSPFERTRVLDPAPDMAFVAEALASAGADLPSLAGLQCAEAWGGTIDSTPDAVPVISAVDGHPGFFLATRFSGHGFGIGPAAGRLAADIVAGDTPVVDPHPYRYAPCGRHGARPGRGALAPADGFYCVVCASARWPGFGMTRQQLKTLRASLASRPRSLRLSRSCAQIALLVPGSHQTVEFMLKDSGIDSTHHGYGLDPGRRARTGAADPVSSVRAQEFLADR
jgi:glycine/D-amino acid oxidase-like deaminating enzyme